MNPIGDLLTKVDDIEVGNGLGNTDAKLSGYDAKFDKMGRRSVPWLAKEKLVVAYFVVIFVVRIILRVIIRIFSCVKPSYLSNFVISVCLSFVEAVLGFYSGCFVCFIIQTISPVV